MHTHTNTQTEKQENTEYKHPAMLIVTNSWSMAIVILYYSITAKSLAHVQSH